MRIADKLTLLFMKRMLAGPRGRSHFLSQVADAENNDEGAVFAALLERAKEDEALHKLVARHAADEERHAELLGARALATGLPRAQVPEHLKLLRRLDEALGGFFGQPLRSNEDVMKAYLLLQVIEERAVTQFPLFKEAFVGLDDETVKVFAEIEVDEERHLKYCQAVAKRYAPSEEVHEKTLQHFREVEAKVFAENSVRNMSYALEQGFLDEAPALVRFGWRLIQLYAAVVKPARPTPYMGVPVQRPILATA
ncbi:MAG: ferritin-like domain-containing protein [Myxococcaceae bacterium]|nr:ferritin-like domain-containing protein [Myxococcaceae bacterium]